MGRRSGLPDLVAVHRDGRAARSTIERLSRAGIDGGAISLPGDGEVVTAGRYGDRQVDLGSSLALGGRIVRGIVWGVVPGAVFGMVLLLAVTDRSPLVLASGAAGGGLLGMGLGILLSLLTIPTMASSWERTFAPRVPGGVAVGVRIEGPRTLRRAAPVLRSSGAYSVVEVVDLDDLAAEGSTTTPDDQTPPRT